MLFIAGLETKLGRRLQAKPAGRPNPMKQK
jgi:hypothetical protein